MSKRLAVRLCRSINIQMVGINRRHNGYIRRQPMERAVVFIRLHHHIFALLVHQHIRAVVHADSAEERIHGIQQMSQHRAGGRLAVRAGYAKRFLLPRHHSQHFRTLADVESLLSQIRVYRAILRNSRRAHNERVAGIESS